MKKMVGFIGMAFLPLMVACSLMARPSQWQPTAVTDFKSVGGKWEGQLIRDHYFTQNYDWATIAIGDTGTCEYAVVRTRTSAQGGSVSNTVVRVLSENGKLALTDGKLSATGSKGGQVTLQLYVTREVVSACLKLRLKIVKGSAIPPISNPWRVRLRKNDDQIKTAATAANEGSGTTFARISKGTLCTEHHGRR